MSAIHRTSGRFFPGHLGNLLAGRMTAALQRHGHDRLPTFGAGKEFKPAEWKSIFHQLHGADLIAQDPDDRDRWILTGTGRAVLKGEAALNLRSAIPLPSGREADARQTLARIERARADDPPPPREEYPRAKTANATAPETAPLTANQNTLLAALKAKRLELARAQKQPAYVIFHDRVLIEMARRQPVTQEELLLIPGVGPAKACRHGAVFLKIIADRGGGS